MAADHHHDHPAHLAHHFQTVEQQFASAKLGMWVFLATEILMFGGLFCGYAVYYSNHHEIFVYGHQFLDKELGGINTVVLICSSLTMAWGVRAAQLGQKNLLVTLLILTLLGGFGFMGIKAVEYNHKWHLGLLPGEHYKTESERATLHHGDDGEHGDDAAAHGASAGADDGHTDDGAGEGLLSDAAHGLGEAADAVTESVRGAAQELGEDLAHAVGGTPDPDPAAVAPPADGIQRLEIERSTIALAPEGPAGLRPMHLEGAHGGHHAVAEPEKARLFFSWYFGMTGLHAIHVLVGMGLITWILIRAMRNEFGPHYFTPVDLVGLYWHLVDLIWIFLFPLLYLVE